MVEIDKRLHVLGVPIDEITFEGMLETVAGWIASPQKHLHHICTVSPEYVMIAQDNQEFMRVLREADLCAADGIGLIFASWYLRHPLPQRVTGSDGMPLIAARAAREGWKLFLLGAGPGVAERAAQELCTRSPGLQIVGVYSGSPAPEEEDDIVQRVNASGADILFVAYGAPKQDLWIARNRSRLNVHMAMGVGGTFDFLAGVQVRAPRWMQRLAVEWLYRLIQEPSRWRRMLRLPRFVWAVLLHGEKLGGEIS